MALTASMTQKWTKTDRQIKAVISDIKMGNWQNQSLMIALLINFENIYPVQICIRQWAKEKPELSREKS